MNGARQSLARIDECVSKLTEAAGNAVAQASSGLLSEFTTALDEDLNVAAGWGVIFDWVRESNRALASGQMTPAQAASALAAWGQIEGILGLARKTEAEVPSALLALLDERNAARKAKDFKRADAIRDQLNALGWVIEDTPKGARLKKI